MEWQQLQVDYLTFWPNGKAYRGLPKKGPEFFDAQQGCHRQPAFCGVYVIRSGQLAITWGDGTETFASLGEEDLHVQGRTYTRQPKSNGLVLDGTYIRPDAPPFDALATKTIVFRRDKTFVDNGVYQSICGVEIVGGNLQFDPATGAGTYFIRGNSIQLIFSNSGERRLSFFVPKSDVQHDRGDVIVINTYGLKRLHSR